MVAGTDTTGCYMGIEMETTLSLEPWEASLNELSLRAPSLPETQPQGAPPQSTQLQLTRPLQGRKEIQSNRNDNALSQGSHEQCVRLSTEGDANTNSTSLKIQKAEKVALRTVPAILKHGTKRTLVNCFLDEGSDTIYGNEHVVEELGVQGDKS